MAAVGHDDDTDRNLAPARPCEVVQDPCDNLVPWDDLTGCPIAVDGELVVLARSVGPRMPVPAGRGTMNAPDHAD